MLKSIVFVSAVLLAVPAMAQQSISATQVLKGVEERYNGAKTLRANFVQTSRFQGRTRPAEKGILYLSRPKKTRWDYSTPQGRVFVSDGQYTHDYDPRDNTYSRETMKETDDMRIPLAFLMGKLDFQKDFGKFIARQEGADAVITAFPKNDKLWFTEIQMTIAPDSSIRRVVVTGQDFSTTEFLLADEQRNVPVAESMFKYAPPAGAKIEAGQ